MLLNCSNYISSISFTPSFPFIPSCFRPFEVLLFFFFFLCTSNREEDFFFFFVTHLGVQGVALGAGGLVLLLTWNSAL